MKKNFKCPKCKTMQSVGKRLHASWQCPKCHKTLFITKEEVRRGELSDSKY